MSTDLITRAELARRMGISTRTVDRLVSNGKLPPPLKFSRKLQRFRADEVAARIEQLTK
jgi:excisionase family DNA binding protein